MASLKQKEGSSFKIEKGRKYEKFFMIRSVHYPKKKKKIKTNLPWGTKVFVANTFFFLFYLSYRNTGLLSLPPRALVRNFLHWLLVSSSLCGKDLPILFRRT